MVYSNESNLLRSIMLAVSKLRNVIVFRNNTGMAWQGDVVSNVNGKLIMLNPRPLNAGLCKGSSDLIGWTSVEITPDMVGQKLAVFTAIEVKGPRGRVTKEQSAFLKRLQDDGGFGAVCRSESDAIKLIQK